MAQAVLRGGRGPVCDIRVFVLQAGDGEGGAVEPQFSRIYWLHTESLPDLEPPLARLAQEEARRAVKQARVQGTTAGIITDIQRFSIHDGPGIRTTVFLKGCNLRCFWCHNPETLRPGPELQVFPEKCIGCGACIAACPNHAHRVTDGGKVFERERCAACGRCAAGCYAEGLVLVGREVSADEVMQEVRQDADFYASSGGGVTLSGGEPLCQAAFARELLARCRAEGFHTAIETNLAWPWDTVASVLPLVDLVMCDVKTMDPAAHRAGTGGGNERVLANLRGLAGTGKPLIVRTPVIPGFNDDPRAIRAVAELVAGLPNVLAYELLPYHPLATTKYAGLGLGYRAAGLQRPCREHMRALLDAAEEVGAPARIPGE